MLEVKLSILINFLLQIAEWIRGSQSDHITKLKWSDSQTYGSGMFLRLSLATWRQFIKKAWLSGLLTRIMSLGVGKGKHYNIVFNTYQVRELHTHILV